ncbi:MAG: hypothetical protein COB04_00325 [Gammaproteobacteria bacterium]|nr:MAG: hypothetical protein COB04_00325 [Gammaproteobacteria bacterium]
MQYSRAIDNKVYPPKVLVVDEDSQHLNVVRDLLQERFDIFTVGSEQECLDTVHGIYPDVILLDAMSEGEGFEFCQVLKGDPTIKSIPVIFITDCNDTAHRLTGYKLGAEDILPNSISKAELLTKIDVVLEKKNATDQLLNDVQKAQDLALKSITDKEDINVILEFMERSFSIDDYPELAKEVVNVLNRYHVSSAVKIRGVGEQYNLQICPKNGALEHELMERLRSFRRVVQFGERIIINFEHITILVRHMPLSNDKLYRRLTSHFVALVGSANAKIESLNNLKEVEENKGLFLAGISHELRTPMHGILSFARIGKKKIHTATNEKLLDYFDNIEKSADRLLSLINDFLDATQLEANKMSFQASKNNLYNTANFAASEFSSLLMEKGVELSVDEPTFSSAAWFDENRILQVYRNLIANAIRFTPKGHQINISFEERTLSLEDGSFPTPSIAVLVQDQGCGVPAQDCQSIFNKFIQLKTKQSGVGTGLGLTICKEIIKASRGTIQVENTDALGACFTFTIPVKQTGMTH